MTWDAELAPLRRALGSAARRRATEVLDAARAEADAVLARAGTEATEIRARARREGEVAGREQAALTAARARREAHRTVLGAQEAARRDLLRRVEQAVVALRGDPRYPALRERLAAECRARLGPAADVVEVADGGVVGDAGSRHLDLSLTALAAAAGEAVLATGEGVGT